MLEEKTARFGFRHKNMLVQFACKGPRRWEASSWLPRRFERPSAKPFTLRSLSAADRLHCAPFVPQGIYEDVGGVKRLEWLGKADSSYLLPRIFSLADQTELFAISNTEKAKERLRTGAGSLGLLPGIGGERWRSGRRRVLWHQGRRRRRRFHRRSDGVHAFCLRGAGLRVRRNGFWLW